MDSFKARTRLELSGQSYRICNIQALGAARVARLPFSLKILLENLLRFEDGVNVTRADIEALLDWDPKAAPSHEIPFTPARVIMQDFTGVPCIVDLAAMRAAITRLGGDPELVNPLAPAELVIDHSVQVDEYGTPQSLSANNRIEFERNGERYAFLRWGQSAFRNFKVVPPNTGIVHQVNLEYLARVVFDEGSGDTRQAYPDTLVGTDSHTTMINGLGVLGWGVGGIEAEAAMLGQPVTMLIPQVVGCRISGSLRAGATATDLVLTVTEMLRKLGVVDKFVEFFGDGLAHLPLADRATISNMSPEFGSTCAIFPIDEETIRYLRLSGRPEEHIALVEAYARATGLWRADGAPSAEYSAVVELDLGTVEPSLAGPSRPQDRVPLRDAKTCYRKSHATMAAERSRAKPSATGIAEVKAGPHPYSLKDGAVLIAAITSCTNTSNPYVLVAAGLLARNARRRGLRPPDWVKTSLAPGSRVVTDYLSKAGLLDELAGIGFDLVGYGCTTCIGNSGPLRPEISAAVKAGDLIGCAVLSGNRNFDGRVHPEIKMNFLASPPLVVAYALAGTLDIDLDSEPLGVGADGRPVFLKELWPAPREIADCVQQNISSAMFRRSYGSVFDGDERWRAIKVPLGKVYAWDRQVHLREEPAVLRGHDDAAARDRRDPRRPRAGTARRFGHDRSYFAGRQYRPWQPRGQIPRITGRAAARFQPVRRPARQPRSHDARHLRQHPSAEPARAGHRGRGHRAHSERRAAEHLRCRHALSRGAHAAHRPRRQGIRHRLLARLGRQGNDAARGARRDRAELRAHPPLEPDRHGRAAVAVRAGRYAQVPRADRPRALRDQGTRAGPGAPGDGDRHAGCGHADRIRRPRAHRHAQGARVLPPRRHPAVRAAAARRAQRGSLNAQGSSARVTRSAL